MGRVEVNLENDTHETWQEHVEQGNRYKTMTQLIRYAVGEQIDRDRGEKGDLDGFDPTQIERAVDESVDSLKTDMRSLRNDVVQTQRVVESLTEEDYHLENAMELHDMLPKVPSIEKAIGGVNSGSVPELESRFREEIDQDISDSDIRIALARLENDVPQVESGVVEGERVYYEEG